MRSGKTGKSGSTRVRAKVVALLVSLAALWAFAAYVTTREGTNLLALNTMVTKVGVPSEELTAALQAERRASVLYLADESRDAADTLAERRAATDEKAAALLDGIADRSVRLVASSDLEAKLADVASHLSGLAATRAAIDARQVAHPVAFDAYTEAIDAVFRAYGSLVTLDDQTIAALGRTLVKLSRALELLHQEDALIIGAIADGDFVDDEHTRFVELVGTQRFLFAEAVSELPTGLREELQQLLDGPEFRQLITAENQVAHHPARALPAGLTVEQWSGVSAAAIEQVRAFVLHGNEVGVQMATPVVAGVIIRFALAGVLGLIAVIASIIISITTARQLVRQLERLRNAARDLASYRLPRVVERLQHGEQVDVKQEAPPLEFGTDEIGQVGEAFNQVQETAIRVAVEQAELRRSVRDVFLSLARRSQALLHRQLGLLDAMERRATDAEELAELFRIDHLATRMRRNAENLIVLSGATAGRAWRKPVPMVDVLRGALAEVEDYTRVTVQPVGNASLLGRAVGDVIHLLAELIENAVSFSPPQTTVRVGGSVVGYGFAIEIEDRGLGMSPEELAAANEQLRDPPEFRLTSTARLGLYVVAKLAERHGIRVRLTESAYGGTTAIVLLPGSLLADDGTDGSTAPDPSQLDSYRPAQLAGVGRHRLQTDTADRVRGEASTAVAVREPAAGSADRTQAPTGAADLDRSSAPVAPVVPATNGTNGRAPSLAPVSRPEPTTTDDQAPDQPAPAPQAEAETPRLTPSGLPFRQRRARSEPAPEPSQGSKPVMSSRDPDATRSLMSSYQSGTLRGRSDAARLTEAQASPPSVPPTRTDPVVPPSAHSDPQWTDPAQSPPVPGSEPPQWNESTPQMRETEEGG